MLGALFLARAFRLQKDAAKQLDHSHSVTLCRRISTVRRSDPVLIARSRGVLCLATRDFFRDVDIRSLGYRGLLHGVGELWRCEKLLCIRYIVPLKREQ